MLPIVHFSSISQGSVYSLCCALGANAVSMPVPGYGAPGGAATRPVREDELYYVIFFVHFHGGSLHRCTFPFGIVCRDFWHDNFYKKRMQSCSCALASQPPTTRLWELLQGFSLTNRSGSTEMCSWWLLSLLSFSPAVKLRYKAHLKDVQDPPILLPPDSALIVLFPEEPRSSLEAGSYFQSHCLLDIPGI